MKSLNSQLLTALILIPMILSGCVVYTDTIELSQVAIKEEIDLKRFKKEGRRNYKILSDEVKNFKSGKIIRVDEDSVTFSITYRNRSGNYDYRYDPMVSAEKSLTMKDIRAIKYKNKALSATITSTYLLGVAVALTYYAVYTPCIFGCF